LKGWRQGRACSASCRGAAILPTDALCQVSPDGSDLAQRLDEDRSNPNNQRAVDAL
jgi:hypothetical protein